MNDELRLAEFLEKHRKKLIGFAQKDIAAASDAEDAFSQLWSKPNRKDTILYLLTQNGEAAALAWCCKAITGEFMDIRRHRFFLKRTTGLGLEDDNRRNPELEAGTCEKQREKVIDELSRTRMLPTSPHVLEALAEDQKLSSQAAIPDWAWIKELVESCFHSLQQAEKPVMLLWMELGCPEEPGEIARHLEKSEGSIKTIKCRAIPKLKACLRQKGFEGSHDLL